MVLFLIGRRMCVVLYITTFTTVTGHLLSSTSPTAVECSQTWNSNGLVEFRFPLRRKDCFREWRYNDEVLAYDDDDGKNSSDEHVLVLTSQSLVLKSCIENITFKEDCLDSQLGERIPHFCNCSSQGSVDDHRRHHYFAVIPALVFVLLVSVLGPGFLCKTKLNLCCLTTPEDAASKQSLQGNKKLSKIRSLPPDVCVN